MITEGTTAPDFTVPIARGGSYDDIGSFTLSEAIGDGPIVLAFYPAAFTSGCTEEMCSVRDSLGEFEAIDARVFGVSVDLPFAQNVWIREHDFGFSMLSDWNHDIVRKYGVVREMEAGFEVAHRSIVVVDGNGTVTYRWLRDGVNPDFDALLSEVRTAVAKPTDE